MKPLSSKEYAEIFFGELKEYTSEYLTILLFALGMDSFRAQADAQENRLTLRPAGLVAMSVCYFGGCCAGVLVS
jgi:hypothetical protein